MPRAKEESMDYSYQAVTRWEAIAGLASPRDFANKLIAISWQSRRQIGIRIKLKLQNDIELNPGQSLVVERKGRRMYRKKRRQGKVVNV